LIQASAGHFWHNWPDAAFAHAALLLILAKFLLEFLFRSPILSLCPAGVLKGDWATPLSKRRGFFMR
jgi:hypothetical protein